MRFLAKAALAPRSSAPPPPLLGNYLTPGDPEAILRWLVSEQAARLRAAIGKPLLTAYLQSRARNRAVDAYVLGLASLGTIDRVLIGQDDAGPQGLHLRDIAELRADAARLGLAGRRRFSAPSTCSARSSRPPRTRG